MSETQEGSEAAREAQFMAWLHSENQRRETARLKQRLIQLLVGQLVTAGFIFFWVCAMFVGFQRFPSVLPAEVAGLVTFTTLFGGGTILWHLHRLAREAERRLQGLRQDPPER